MKNIRIFYLKIFPVLVVKFSIYLNRNVFVMFENGVLLMCTLEGISSVANSITAYEESQ